MAPGQQRTCPPPGPGAPRPHHAAGCAAMGRGDAQLSAHPCAPYTLSITADLSLWQKQKQPPSQQAADRSWGRTRAAEAALGDRISSVALHPGSPALQ